jgi:hypothetical protein
LLLSRRLFEQGINIVHVLAYGGTKSHEQALERLAANLKMPPDDIFRPRDEVISDADLAQSEVIAYQEKLAPATDQNQAPSAAAE